MWRVVTFAGFVFLFVELAFGLGSGGLNDFADRWVYDTLEVLAAAGCLARAASTRSERWVWAVLGLGILSFALGDICFDFVYDGSPPGISICDAFYLAFYPACYAALALLVRSRISAFERSVWLDGAIAALSASAVSAAIVLQVVIENTHGGESTMIVDLAYPVADLVLLAMVVTVFVLTGRRPGRAWATAGAAFGAITFADSMFMYLNANGTFTEGSLVDALWPAALLLLAVAAWQPVQRESQVELEGRVFASVPLACGVVALAVLIAGRFYDHNMISDALASAAILTVFIRTGLSFVDNTRLLAHTRTQSLTDHLTGLGNRRSLMITLERELTREGLAQVLVIFDLNGFKRYNDKFGHLSGDELLARLAGRLALAMAGARGQAFRLGGDEFCILAPIDRHGVEALIDAGIAALSEEGEGFRIGAEHGAVRVPEEASEPTAALALADERLYAQKYNLYRGDRKAHQILLRALNHHETGMQEDSPSVVELSALVGERLGVTGHSLEQLRLAAELHDIGKLAAPDAVLQIVAVCDAYATMTSERRNRRTMTPAEALAELRRCAGTQFDREVVFAFCRLHDDAYERLPEIPAAIRAVN
ncbi:MAG TPA: diguanylate cyclase [Gaiellaceae bacterium]